MSYALGGMEGKHGIPHRKRCNRFNCFLLPSIFGVQNPAANPHRKNIMVKRVTNFQLEAHFQYIIKLPTMFLLVFCVFHGANVEKNVLWLLWHHRVKPFFIVWPQDSKKIKALGKYPRKNNTAGKTRMLMSLGQPWIWWTWRAMAKNLSKNIKNKVTNAAGTSMLVCLSTDFFGLLNK